MGSDIHTRAEKRVNGKWEVIPFSPFDWRNYDMFAFLAGVRNSIAITPISTPRGIPDDEPLDVNDEPPLGDHSWSWLSVEELASYNYDQEIEIVVPPPAGSDEPAGRRRMTLRFLLGSSFFDDIKKLQDLGAERIVFGFDN